jgi:transcription factor SPN1
MSVKKEPFNLNTQIPKSFCSNVNSYKDYSVKELKTSHNGLVCINYNSEYLRERLCKLKEESNFLKQKLNTMDALNLREKNNLEKIILALREENHILKQNVNSQKLAIEHFLEEKEKILKDLKEAKKLNNDLRNEKMILMERIKESNNLINNNITPKLKTNENDLAFLKNKINEMQNTIINLKNENSRLIDENMNKNEMIKILSLQNKKLMNEIKMKYNKDLNFIQDLEKFGIETNMSNEMYYDMKKRYENDNDNDKNIIKNRNNKKLKNEKTTSRSDKYDVNEKI